MASIGRNAGSPKRARPGVVVAVLAAIACIGLTTAAAAQESESEGAASEAGSFRLPVVVQVDATEPEVELAVLAERYDPEALSVAVTERGEPVSVSKITTAQAEGLPMEIVFVVDVHNRNAQGGALGAVGRSILDSIATLPSNTRVAVVTAGETATVAVPFTTSIARLERSLLDLRAQRGSVINDAINVAASVFSFDPGVVRTVVLVAGGSDSGSLQTPKFAAGRIVQRNAQLVALYPEGTGDIDSIVAAAGGTVFVGMGIEDAADSVATATAVAADRMLVRYVGDAEPGERMDATFSVAERTQELAFAAGVVSSGSAQITPKAEVATGRFGAFFGSRLVLYGSVLLAFACIVMAIFSLGSMFIAGESNLDILLSRYAEEGEQLDDKEMQELIVQSNLLRRAVDIAEALAEDRGVLVRVERMLERADLPMRAGEALFFLAGSSALTFGVVWVASGSILTATVTGLGVVAFGYFMVQYLVRRRLTKFERQLPDTLNMLAGTLRAGYSLPQGLNAVSEEISDPMGNELRRAMTETQLGREIDDSLGGVAERLDSPDFAWAVMAIGIQREVGGNLNELLTTVADTMVQRERLSREVSALTAEGRMSAIIISMLPPGLGFVLWLLNPEYVQVLFSNRIGLALLGAATVSAMVGLLWMKKVITIDA